MNADVYALLIDALDDMTKLYEQQAETIGHIIRSEFERLSENARKRLYSGEVIFRDLKKHVLKHPL